MGPAQTLGASCAPPYMTAQFSRCGALPLFPQGAINSTIRTQHPSSLVYNPTVSATPLSSLTSHFIPSSPLRNG